MKWFTADHHFGHTNIIEYCNRPFDNEVHMTKELIKRHNEVVKKGDDVFIIGDFSLKRSGMRGWYENIVHRLNGNLHLIMGNHDYNNPFFYHDIGFHSVHTVLEIEGYVLAHDPAWANVDMRKQFLVGHVHNIFRRANNAFNVGVDMHDFYPVSMDAVDEEFTTATMEHSYCTQCGQTTAWGCLCNSDEIPF